MGAERRWDRWFGTTWPERAAVLVAAIVPTAPDLVPASVLLFIVAVVRERWLAPRAPIARPGLASPWPWMALLYVLTAAGLLWTTDLPTGLFELEVKASFLLFPLLLLVWPAHRVFDPAPALRMFMHVAVLSVLVWLLAAAWRFGHEVPLYRASNLPPGAPWTNHFFESRFSLVLHPSYLAMYLTLAVVIWLHGPTEGRRAWWLPLVAAIGVVLCNSKMGWLAFAVVVPVALLHGGVDARLRRRLAGAFMGGVLLFAALYAAFPTVSGKITQAISATGPIDPLSTQSSQLRRMAWDAATDIIADRPATGAGTGDVTAELMVVYAAKGYDHAHALRMNAHSQFLQTAATLGVPGLLAVLAMLFAPVFHAGWRRPLPLLFLLLTWLHWSVESMGQVQAGVVFFAFIGWLLQPRSVDVPRSSRT